MAGTSGTPLKIYLFSCIFDASDILWTFITVAWKVGQFMYNFRSIRLDPSTFWFGEVGNPANLNLLVFRAFSAGSFSSQKCRHSAKNCSCRIKANCSSCSRVLSLAILTNFCGKLYITFHNFKIFVYILASSCTTNFKVKISK